MLSRPSSSRKYIAVLVMGEVVYENGLDLNLGGTSERVR